jgi:hypothetical protein
MTTNRPLRVFLCHSSNDKPAVRELYQKLRAEQWIQPWLDEEELHPGQTWETEIEKAVESTDVVLVCLSNNSINKRGFVQKELRFALDVALEMPEETIFIIPLRLEKCTPPRSLREWQYANYFEGQREQGIKRLLISLRYRAKSLDLGTAKPLLVNQVLKSTSIVTPKPDNKLPKNINLPSPHKYSFLQELKQGVKLRLPRLKISINLGLISIFVYLIWFIALNGLFTNLVWIPNNSNETIFNLFTFITTPLPIGVALGWYSAYRAVSEEKIVSNSLGGIVGAISGLISGVFLYIGSLFTFPIAGVGFPFD